MRTEVGNIKSYGKEIDKKTELHLPKEYICGAIASMVNIFVLFPLHKTVFFQQLEGINFAGAFTRLRAEGISNLYRGVLPPLLQRSATASVMFGFQSQSQRFLQRHQPTMELPPPIKTMISATMAGSLEAALTPFERVQTLLQSSYNSHMYKNTSRAIYNLLKFHGFRELYRGFTPVILRNCTGNVLYFSGKNKLQEKCHSHGFLSGHRHLSHFLIGGFLGSTIGAILFPLNVAKTQMQSVVGSSYGSLRLTLWCLLNERHHVKIGRLYSGLPVNFTRSLLSWGIITMIYEWLLAL